MEPVVAQFQWTADDLLTARRWHQKHVCRPFFRWAVHITLVLIVAVSLYSLFRSGLSAIPVGFLVAAFYIYFLRRFEVRWLTRRQFAKRPDRNSEIQWSASPQGLSTAATHGRSDFQWTALTKVLHTPDGFLFYPTEEVFHFLPRRGFRDETDFDRLAQLAREHAPKFIAIA